MSSAVGAVRLSVFQCSVGADLETLFCCFKLGHDTFRLVKKREWQNGKLTSLDWEITALMEANASIEVEISSLESPRKYVGSWRLTTLIPCPFVTPLFIPLFDGVLPLSNESWIEIRIEASNKIRIPSTVRAINGNIPELSKASPTSPLVLALNENDDDDAKSVQTWASASVAKCHISSWAVAGVFTNNMLYVSIDELQSNGKRHQNLQMEVELRGCDVRSNLKIKSSVEFDCQQDEETTNQYRVPVPQSRISIPLQYPESYSYTLRICAAPRGHEHTARAILNVSKALESEQPRESRWRGMDNTSAIVFKGHTLIGPKITALISLQTTECANPGEERPLHLLL